MKTSAVNITCYTTFVQCTSLQSHTPLTEITKSYFSKKSVLFTEINTYRSQVGWQIPHI